MLMRRGLSVAVVFWAIACAVVLTGCASGPSGADVRAFGDGVRAVESQALGALEAVNTRGRVTNIERAATLPTLSEASFVEPVDPADIERWRVAFAAVQDYAAAVAVLADAGNERDRVAIGGLGDALVDLGATSMPDGVGGAVASLGATLVDARARAGAAAVAASADEAVRGVFVTMAEAIGATKDEGLRASVWRSFSPEMAELSVAFLDEGNMTPRKRRLAEDYAGVLDDRAAADRVLASVHRSLLDLAAAHSAMATGGEGSTRAVLARVNASVDRALVVVEEIASR